MLTYPPRELWPEKIYSLPELSYPDTLNACHELLDRNLDEGRGSSPAIYFKDSVVTYSELHHQVMNIAGALRRRGIQPPAKSNGLRITAVRPVSTSCT